MHDRKETIKILQIDIGRRRVLAFLFSRFKNGCAVPIYYEFSILDENGLGRGRVDAQRS